MFNIIEDTPESAEKVIRKDSLEYMEMVRLLNEASVLLSCAADYDDPCEWHRDYDALLEVL